MAGCAWFGGALLLLLLRRSPSACPSLLLLLLLLLLLVLLLLVLLLHMLASVSRPRVVSAPSGGEAVSLRLAPLRTVDNPAVALGGLGGVVRFLEGGRADHPTSMAKRRPA